MNDDFWPNQIKQTLKFEFDWKTNHTSRLDIDILFV